VNSPAPDRNNQERITAAFILLTPVMCEALFAYTFYGNLVPNDFWVFVGVGLKREGLAGCKALDVGSACCDDSILFVKPPDREKHLTRLFLSAAGDFALNISASSFFTLTQLVDLKMGAMESAHTARSHRFHQFD